MTLAEIFIEPFADFAFMRRALAGVLVLAVSAAPVGVFLMLRRMSLVGDAMAHAILPGVAIGFVVAGLDLFAMTLGGMLVGLAVAVLATLVARFTILREDASLAAFYLVSLALGVTLVSVSGSAVDVLHVLFGTVLALDDASLFLIAGVATVTLVTLALILRPLVVECVDPGFLRQAGGPGPLAHLAFTVLVVINLVAGFQALGTLLAVGLMILPAASARLWARSLGGIAAVATTIALASGYLGLVASFWWDLPSGPAVILVAGAAHVVSVLAGPVGGLAPRLLPRPGLAR